VRALGLRAEDLLLAGWNIAGIPAIAAGGLAPILSLGDAPDPTAGIIQLVAVVGAIVAIATRPSGRTPADSKLLGEARVGFMGPLVGAIAFVSGSASAYLGFGVDGLAIGAAFIAIVLAMMLGDRLPVINAGLRRAMLFPFVAISAGVFNGFAADIIDGLDVGALISTLTVDETGFGLFIVGMLVAGLAFFYASLVVAPRMLVDPEIDSGCLVWPARFVLYLVSAVLGIGWLSVLAV
jgi:hypothetical protein